MPTIDSVFNLLIILTQMKGPTWSLKWKPTQGTCLFQKNDKKTERERDREQGKWLHTYMSKWGGDDSDAGQAGDWREEPWWLIVFQERRWSFAIEGFYCLAKLGVLCFAFCFLFFFRGGITLRVENWVGGKTNGLEGREITWHRLN